MKKILITLTVLSIISFFTFASIYNVQQDVQRATKQEQTKIETYTYKITKVDSKGYYGISTKDQSGIYFVNNNVPKGIKINVNDTIKVSFPLNNYEEITHIEKLTN
jgi:hypothetical protein